MTTHSDNEHPTLVESLSLTERLSLVFLIFITCVSGIWILHKQTQKNLLEVPVRGGTYKEILIGRPVFINPLLAQSESEKDLTEIVYSGLLRRNIDGTFEPDLAQSFEVLEGGRTYSLRLRPEAQWHDGEKITVEDVAFTIQLAQNATLNPKLAAAWQGIKVEVLDAHTIVFKLGEPYVPFLSQLTLGILPEHLWSEIDVEDIKSHSLNENPIGSGAFYVREVDADNKGVPKRYILGSFVDYVHGRPYLESLEFVFSERDAFPSPTEQKEFGFASPAGEEVSAASKHYQVVTSPMDRVYSVYFNPTEDTPVRDKAVREALSLIIDRERLVENVLEGYGTITKDAIPTRDLKDTEVSNEPEVKIAGKDLLEQARQILSEAQWEYDEESHSWSKDEELLSFTLQTPNISDLTETADYIKGIWETLGAEVTVTTLSPDTFQQEVITPRAFEAILFAVVVNEHTDVASLWHSTQRDTTGLNITGFVNSEADKVIEKIRQTTDEEDRTALLNELNELINETIPSIPLYQPHFIYRLPNQIKNPVLPPIALKSDRFRFLHTWYVYQDKVWPFFAQ